MSFREVALASSAWSAVRWACAEVRRALRSTMELVSSTLEKLIEDAVKSEGRLLSRLAMLAVGMARVA